MSLRVENSSFILDLRRRSIKLWAVFRAVLRLGPGFFLPVLDEEVIPFFSFSLSLALSLSLGWGFIWMILRVRVGGGGSSRSSRHLLVLVRTGLCLVVGVVVVLVPGEAGE